MYLLLEDRGAANAPVCFSKAGVVGGMGKFIVYIELVSRKEE